MKTYLKSIATLLLWPMLFTNCSGDSSEDTPPDEGTETEIEIEDFANFEGDAKFREYVEKLTVVTSKITDHEKVLELLKEPELDDTQQTELAITLGFEGVEQMNIVYDELDKEWDALALRFDLKNQSPYVIDNMVFRTLIGFRYRERINAPKFGKNDLDNLTNEEVHCYYEVCGPGLIADHAPYSDALDRCRESETSASEYSKCRGQARQRFSAQLRKAEINMACCLRNRCELDYPMLEGEDEFDYGLCPILVG